MTGGGLLVYRCAPDITWVKDAGQTILVSADTGCSWFLGGWQAAVWDLLCLGYRTSEIVRFLALLLDLQPKAARCELVVTLKEWEGKGIVCAEEGGCG